MLGVVYFRVRTGLFGIVRLWREKVVRAANLPPLAHESNHIGHRSLDTNRSNRVQPLHILLVQFEKQVKFAASGCQMFETVSKYILDNNKLTWETYLMDEREYKFPEEFLWGASISSHQVEGSNINDWSEWEKKYAVRLAEESKGVYGYWQPWQVDMFPEMKNPENYVSGKACDHYNRFKEDFRLAKNLGHNAARISIEWSRIEPNEGEFDEREIEHYKNVVSLLKELDIEPFVTIWHWTIPLWLRDKGGWVNRRTAGYFVRYAEKVVNSLGKDVRFWITLNEPEIYSSSHYTKGLWPPEKKSFINYLVVLHNLIEAHKLAYSAIKKIYPNSHVGAAKDNIYFEAYRSRVKNRIAKKAADLWWNQYFFLKIGRHQDFIGLWK